MIQKNMKQQRKKTLKLMGVVSLILFLHSACTNFKSEIYGKDLFLKYDYENGKYLIYYFDLSLYLQNKSDKIIKLSMGDLHDLYKKSNKKIKYSTFLYNIFNEKDKLNYDYYSFYIDEKIKAIYTESGICGIKEMTKKENWYKCQQESQIYTINYYLFKNGIFFNKKSKKLENVIDVIEEEKYK